LQLRNLLYIKELAIFSVEPLETQPGFSEVPSMRQSGESRTAKGIAGNRFSNVKVIWPVSGDPALCGQKPAVRRRITRFGGQRGQYPAWIVPGLSIF
jgi:hypothetical protein